MTTMMKGKACAGCGASISGPMSRCRPCRGVAVAALREDRDARDRGEDPPARVPGRVSTLPAEPQKATGPTMGDILNAINGMREDVARLAARLTHIETRIGSVATSGAEMGRSVESIRAALRVMVERMPMGGAPEGRQASPEARSEIPARDVAKGAPPGPDPASRLGVESSRQIELD